MKLARSLILIFFWIGISHALGNTYGNWKTQVFSAAEQANPAISGETADIMSDGIPNLMKYALGLDRTPISILPCHAPIQTPMDICPRVSFRMAASPTSPTSLNFPPT
jgi:hypothetical protein